MILLIIPELKESRFFRRVITNFKYDSLLSKLVNEQTLDSGINAFFKLKTRI